MNYSETRQRIIIDGKKIVHGQLSIETIDIEQYR